MGTYARSTTVPLATRPLALRVMLRQWRLQGHLLPGLARDEVRVLAQIHLHVGRPFVG